MAVRGWDLFGLVRIPALSQDRDLRSTVNGWHELAANTIVILAAVHAAAALVYHYLWRDGVLRRMLPWSSRG